MLSAQQKSCIELIVENLPEPIKDSTVMLDIADDSMRHIMGGDPLESLRLKCARQVISNVASMDQETLANYLKTNNIDSYSDSFLNKSPEIMMSIFDNCQWAPSDVEKEVKINIKTNKMLIKINNITYFNIFPTDEDSIVPQWLPYLLRQFIMSGIHQINIQFEGEPEEYDQLQVYEKQLFDSIQKADYSKRGTHIYPTSTVNWNYFLMRGSLCCSSNSKRKGGATIFSKLSRRPSTRERDMNEVIREDFTSKL